MADEILRSKHGFGTSAGLENAISEGKLDAFDVIFLSDPDGNKIGWIDREGNVHMVENGMAATEVEEKISAAVEESKTYADEKVETVVEEKVAEVVDVALEAYSAEKFEIVDAPEGTLVNYGQGEIRILIPQNAVFTKQTVGAGGDPNTYYVTLKTYFTEDEIVGYREHLGDQVDAEILKDIKTDANGRRYQPSWLGVAKYDEASDTWSYYGALSDETRYIGWNYRIDKYDANDVMIASDFVRINLSNEDCHFSLTPSYVTGVITEANTYTDQKIAEIAVGYEIVEF